MGIYRWVMFVWQIEIKRTSCYFTERRFFKVRKLFQKKGLGIRHGYSVVRREQIFWRNFMRTMGKSGNYVKFAKKWWINYGKPVPTNSDDFILLVTNQRDFPQAIFCCSDILLSLLRKCNGYDPGSFDKSIVKLILHFTQHFISAQ